MKQTLSLALALLFLSAPALAQEQWAQFRGPNGQGISSATGLPTRWSATENIAWRTTIPGADTWSSPTAPGTNNSWSSPVIWNNHIFLTTTTDGGQECRVIEGEVVEEVPGV